MLIEEVQPIPTHPSSYSFERLSLFKYIIYVYAETFEPGGWPANAVCYIHSATLYMHLWCRFSLHLLAPTPVSQCGSVSQSFIVSDLSYQYIASPSFASLFFLWTNKKTRQIKLYGSWSKEHGTMVKVWILKGFLTESCCLNRHSGGSTFLKDDNTLMLENC